MAVQTQVIRTTVLVANGAARRHKNDDFLPIPICTVPLPQGVGWRALTDAQRQAQPVAFAANSANRNGWSAVCHQFAA